MLACVVGVVGGVCEEYRTSIVEHERALLFTTLATRFASKLSLLFC
jgi:hypothetical protein